MSEQSEKSTATVIVKDNNVESSLKPNKSTLHEIIKNNKKKTDDESEKENSKNVVKENETPKNDKEKKLEKNVSTLYKIISSQSMLVKQLEKDDDEGIEYENVIEKSKSNGDKEKETTVAENTIYFSDGGQKEKKKNLEIKKSTVEIKISSSSSSCCDLTKKSQTNLNCPEHYSTPEPHVSPSKTVKKEGLNLSDLCSIRFSFLDDGHLPDDKSKDYVYDTIDESKTNVEATNRDYVTVSDSSGTENVYSSPRTSLNSQTVSGEFHTPAEYVTSDQEAGSSADKSDGDSELFYATSEVLNLRPPTPYKKRKSSSDYEDLEIEDEELPEIPTKSQEIIELDEYADVDVDDYCRHREENPKKLNINPKDKKAIVKVRSKINKAWKSMKNWINEDREIRECSNKKLPLTIDVIKVLREEKETKEVDVDLETIARSESPDSESPKFCFSNENIKFIDVEKRENSDSGTYVDMTRSQIPECSGDIFQSLTMLRKKLDGSSSGTPSLKKCGRIYPEGQNGFEELRRYIKQGGDFCKELSVILQERSEAENQYAKSLSKLSHKLLKTSKDAVGTVSEAWQRLGAEMEVQSEIHRNFAVALSEDVVKPLKQLIDSQHRIRKNVEGIVDKTAKTLTEWRQAECKSKKQSFLCARENEKLQDTILDVRNNRNASTLHLHHHNHKNVSDKESAKLDLKRKKAEESVKKADIEYYSFCVRAERCRLDWESAVTRGSYCFQGLEEERLSCLKNLASCYLKHFKEIGPRLTQSCDRLTEPIETCDVTRDIQTVAAMKGSGQLVQEQLLPDFYAEHVTLAMNRERRKQALVKLLQLIRQDLERERRGKEGVENLQRALQQTPNFGAEESQQNVDEKLHHMKSMLIYLEAARYKVQSALTELNGRPKSPHPLASHIHMTRDRQGLQQSILRVPYWAKNEAMGERTGHDSPDWTGREAGDGTSVQPDSDFDEFSSAGSEKDYQCSVYNVPIISECNGDTEKTNLGQCRALYEYTAKVYDELNLRIGDIIKIHDKHPDGWWLGELEGVIGIFPATYVEEINALTP